MTKSQEIYWVSFLVLWELNPGAMPTQSLCLWVTSLAFFDLKTNFKARVSITCPGWPWTCDSCISHSTIWDYEPENSGCGSLCKILLASIFHSEPGSPHLVGLSGHSTTERAHRGRNRTQIPGCSFQSALSHKDWSRGSELGDNTLLGPSGDLSGISHSPGAWNISSRHSILSWSVGPSVGAQPKLAASYRFYLVITEYRKLALARASELGFYCCICDQEPTFFFFFLAYILICEIGIFNECPSMFQANKGALTLGTYGVCVEAPSSPGMRGHRGCLCTQYLSPCHSWDEGTHSCR